MQSLQSILIVGGGFAGVRAALDLAKDPRFQVTLISNNKNFEYQPGFHKIVGVSKCPTYQIPLGFIFRGSRVKVVIDTVTQIQSHKRTIVTATESYTGDVLILALGSQTDYFNIQGLKEVAFGFKSAEEAVRLRAHIEELFEKHVTTEKTETVVGLHMVVVGAGPNGVDLAGELAALGKRLAKKYGIIESLLTIDLVEAGPRVLGMLPESVSHRVEKRLRSLGVNVLCNRDLQKDESWTVTLADTTIGARTLIWTAGVTSNELITKVEGFTFGKKRRVIVDEYLQAKGFQNLFCIGDVADTPYAGLAQTALYDAEYITNVIKKKALGKKYQVYIPHPNAFNIGVGPRWSVMQIGSLVSYGVIPYIVRTFIDIKFFLSILPIAEVWKLYFSQK